VEFQVLDSSSKSAISLDELVALNDEIISLVRAGVPLERGLRSLGNDLPGRLGQLAGDLSDRLDQGQSLVDALDESRDGFPRIYRAVVAAGIRSGRLSAALEGLSATARRASELRRLIIISLVYPVIVLIVASLVFVFTALNTAPVVIEVSVMLGVEQPWWYQQLQRINDIGPHALIYIWIVFVVVGVSWLYYTSRAKGLNLRGMLTVAKMLYTGRMGPSATCWP
jgi:general secretion pathway protein F